MAPLGSRGGGAYHHDGASVGAFVNVIGVEDVDAIITKAVELGGSVALEAMDVPGVGRLGYCKDTDNNIFGVIKPSMPPGPSAA